MHFFPCFLYTIPFHIPPGRFFPPLALQEAVQMQSRLCEAIEIPVLNSENASLSSLILPTTLYFCRCTVNTGLPCNLLCTFLPSQKVVGAFKNSLTIILMLYLLFSACTVLTQQNVNTGLSQPPAFCTPTPRLLKNISNNAKCCHYSMSPTVTGP